MKKINNFAYAALAISAVSAVAMQSCSIEEPFGQGDGILQMRLEINSDVTRAEVNDEELAANCVVYISDSKGLIYKRKGLENIDDQITLRPGGYVAEAWTGDSVPASFDKKFYRCYQPFTVETGLNELTLNCKIANVVASVDASVDALVRDFKVTVSNSTGSLEFDSNNQDSRGYFMMPYNDSGVRESELKVVIEGLNDANESFSKEHVIKGVKTAHEYVIGVTSTPDQATPEGGGYITITIDERESVISQTVPIFAAPTIEGVMFDIDKQIIGEQGQFDAEKIVKVTAFNDIRSFTLQCIDMENLHLPSTSIDIKNCTADNKQRLNDAGITWDSEFKDDHGYDGIQRKVAYIYFSPEYFNSLPERSTEYIITLTATDEPMSGQGEIDGKTTVKHLRIAVGEDAIVYEDPLIVEDAYSPTNQMAIGARRATLTASVKDDTATGLGIMYREQGASDWTKVPLNVTRAGITGSVTLTNLKPGTTYEYKAYADGFEASESKTFMTESVFVIPNASMEEWSTYKASTMLGTRTVILPWSVGDKNASFWGSGNEGSATASITILNKYGEMKHTGSYSARLASNSALGVIAAGNIFVGTYVETDGTNGVLSLGREYNGSHPSKVRVYANYRPGGGVTIQDGNEEYVDIEKGGTDQGQIYVALTTEPIEIRTKSSNRNLFPSSPINEDGKQHPDYDKVIAYGQVTWDSAFGPEKGLEQVDIPFEYTSKAATSAPKYLVIVASASKFGDFFSGSSSSVMCLDDFELIYE